MWANKNTKNAGYTIVETMIALAVSAALLTSTALLISGQIERYRYRDGMFRLQTLVQSEINNVQTGYFGDAITGSSNDTANSDSRNTDVIIGKRLIFDQADPSIFTSEVIIAEQGVIGPTLVFAWQTRVADSVNNTLPTTAQFRQTVLPSSNIAEIYILYSSAFEGGLFGATASDTSGNFPVKLFVADPPSRAFSQLGNSNAVTACFGNGSDSGSLVFGANNSDFVTLNIIDSNC
jgi:type II secretory pathway pseudopilin PulG